MPTRDDHANVERELNDTAMPFRTLGRTGLQVSALAFGAGPISTLMVGDDRARQDAVVRAAVARGINWFDTAATYGGGQSEQSLGRAFEELKCAAQVHVATKVRLTTDDLADVRGAVRRSLEGSLSRLRMSRVALLQGFQRDAMLVSRHCCSLMMIHDTFLGLHGVKVAWGTP